MPSALARRVLCSPRIIRLRIDAHRLSPGAELVARAGGGELDEVSELFTYVVEGALVQRGSGGSRVVSAGEFQLRGGGALYQANASRRDGAHVVQVRLGGAPARGVEQRRFCAAERRGRLCVVASPDGQARSLSLAQDARIYSALLDAGQHLVHALRCARHAELHVVRGRLTQVVDGRAISLTAIEPSEILLVDLSGPPS